ncbi:MAG: hypothetical protein AAF192_01155 [Pseudomonadota bacterium]
MTRPDDRIDAALFAALGSATGVDRLAAAAREVPAALRFVEIDVVSFSWGGVPVYMTAPDLIAFATAVALLTRFAVWIARGVLDLFNRRPGE